MFGIKILKIASTCNRRCLIKSFASLPPHQVVGLPALSPTMTNGSISKWEKKVGEKCNPGESIAQLETDKASISFDAQDEFYIAKFLVEEGAEVAVGSAIMITVEEKDDVGAFANYVHTTTAAPAAVEVKPVVSKPEPVKVEAPKPVMPAPAVIKQAAPVPTPASIPTPKVVSPPQSITTSTKVVWGASIKSSPLIHKLASLQGAYVSKYGFSGHTPLEVKKPSEKKEKK